MNIEREAPEGAAAGRELELELLANHLEQSHELLRRTLARELHDQFGSLLISAKMDIESVSSRLGDGQTELVTRLRRAQSALEQAVDIKRKMVEELRPSLLDNLGLATALEWLVSEACRTAGLAHTLSVTGEVPDSGPIPIAMFRIVEQTFANIIRPAHAKHVSVEVAGDTSNISLIVEHDGDDLPTASADTGSTHGIASMRQRAKALGGELSVKPRAGGGAVVEVNLPQMPSAPAA